MNNKSKAYGIDLGTTYSCIAYVDDHGQPIVLQNSDGELTTPSVVFFEEGSENIVVGQVAKDAAVFSHHRVISTIKRAMGTDAVFDFDGRTYTPQDISSFILRRLVDDAAAITNDEIRDVVITCPAYFGFNEKEATKQAGELAGLNVLHVIPEPTAAAIAYGINQDQDQVVLVYDLGGGTFDITLIEVKQEAITVIATGGNKELGGKDWDDAVAAWFMQRFEEETGVLASDLENDPETWQQLQIAAEKCKRALSTRATLKESVQHGANRKAIELSREQLDEMTRDRLEQTLALTRSMIDEARNKGYAQIDKLLLVGGSTYMPQVEDAVKQFGIEILRFDPNQAVAKGAAIFAYKAYLNELIKIQIAEKTGQEAETIDLAQIDQQILEEVTESVAVSERLSLPGIQKFTRFDVADITSRSFGIVVVDEKGDECVKNLAIINDRVPKKITDVFGTYEDNQTNVLIRLMQNEKKEEKVALVECEEVDNKELVFEQALPQQSPIEVTFTLEADGRLVLSAKDLTTNREIHIKTQTAAIMSQEQIETAKSRNLAMRVTN